jgi:hypothetical protein
LDETSYGAAEFPVKTDQNDSESSVEIQVVYLFVRFEYSFNLSVGKMCGRGEANGVADGEEKWNLIHKENVSRKSDLLVEVENFFWDLNKVRNHRRWLGASGFAF